MSPVPGRGAGGDAGRGAPSHGRGRGRSALLALALMLGGSGCGGGQESRTALGPHDGHDLPPADTGRVRVGDLAPDFTLESYGHGVVTLSDYRGAKDVILVFYRGHW